MEQKGFLVLSDISGYSSYLNQSELEHAHETLTDLLNLLIERTDSPLQIFKLEGDAVFSYAPSGAFHQGQTLLEVIENSYLAFRKALQLMTLNTTCPCNACGYIPNLDLKFFVHYGTYTVQEMGQYRELLGSDVNLVHRITKNRIGEKLGKKAYAAFTQAVIDELQMHDLAGEMEALTDSYPDAGELTLFVHDMHSVWEARKDEVSLAVDPADALYVGEDVFPIPPPLLWEYITKPEYRTIFFNSDSQTLKKGEDGRIGKDSVYVCAHGKEQLLHTILDWQPFEQYTMRQWDPSVKLSQFITLRLHPEGQGTRLQFLLGKFENKGLKAWLFDKLMPMMIKRNEKNTWEPIRKKILEDLEAGSAAVAPRIKLGEGLAAEGASQSLGTLPKAPEGN